MKVKILTVILTVMIAAALPAGCAGGVPSPSAGGEVVIAASFYPVYIMLLNIADGIPGVTVVEMVQPTAGCLHDYAVTTADMLNLEKARFLVINGAGMESFMGRVSNRFPGLTVIDSSENVPLIEDGAGGANPHIWVSVSNAAQQVRNISGKLAELDPERAAAYEANADAYVKKLEALKGRMHAALDNLPNRDVVTFHEAFPYFAREFGLNIAGVVEREPGSEPSARELAETIDGVNRLGVTALFAEPQYPASAAEAIARETGARVFALDPAVTGPMGRDAYTDIMESNLRVLEEALH